MKKLITLILFVGGMAMAGAAMPGLAVGEKAPDFNLTSATGENVSLAGLLEQGGVTLVFVRSADWCPYCRRQLQDLEAARTEIEAAGTQVVAISYDAAETLAMAADKLVLSFPLLADEGSAVIDAFGLRNAEAKGRAAGIAHPVVFVVDGDGMIRAKLSRDDYKERPESEEIIAAVKGM